MEQTASTKQTYRLRLSLEFKQNFSWRSRFEDPISRFRASIGTLPRTVGLDLTCAVISPLGLEEAITGEFRYLEIKFEDPTSRFRVLKSLIITALIMVRKKRNFPLKRFDTRFPCLSMMN
ncbi:hypothetical protein M9H77_12041 [Catharanthus roseus]|uniref:Uncharacterized protein n=1 Tax=Catharanthus roseus TaxID=4058 RepID=A0ACC0BGB3_CATRO|nr:hypothetical protein M9H77_12041 [Catharanthus roseus]